MMNWGKPVPYNFLEGRKLCFLIVILKLVDVFFDVIIISKIAHGACVIHIHFSLFAVLCDHADKVTPA